MALAGILAWISTAAIDLTRGGTEPEMCSAGIRSPFDLDPSLTAFFTFGNRIYRATLSLKG